MNSLVYTDEALREVDVAVDWYELQTAGIGVRFYHEVLRVAEEIKQHPEQGALYPRTELRFRRLDKFPYLLVYDAVHPPLIRIVAVAHASRRPGYWADR